MRFLKTSVLVLAVEIMKQPPGKPEFSSLQVSGAVCNDPVPSFGVDKSEHWQDIFKGLRSLESGPFYRGEMSQ
jgi:hypothetical protein